MTIRVLQACSHIAFVVLCLSLSAKFLGLVPAQSNHEAHNNEPKLGSLAPEVVGVDYSRSRSTVLLFLREDCRFCTESLPFYSDLANRAAEQDQLSVVAVFGGPKESSEEYLATARVGIPVIGNANFASAGVAATPTILVASQDGRVSGYWRGRLTPARQDELLRKVGLL